MTRSRLWADAARVIEHLDETLKLTGEDRNRWLGHWNASGFRVLEKMLRDDGASGRYCHGDQPTVTDIALVSQVFVAGKFDVDPAAIPKVGQVHGNCRELSAFSDTAPELQPDARIG